MTVIVIDIIAIVVVGSLALCLRPDRRGRGIGFIRWFKVGGLVPLGLQVCVLTLFGIGEMASGDQSGAGHLVTLAAGLLLALLAWLRPIEGGIGLLLVGAASATQVTDATARLILVDPQLVAGCIFLLAGVAGWRAAAPPSGNGS